MVVDARLESVAQLNSAVSEKPVLDLSNTHDMHLYRSYRYNACNDFCKELL